MNEGFRQFCKDIVRHSFVCGCHTVTRSDAPENALERFDKVRLTVSCGARPELDVASVTLEWDEPSEKVVMR